MTLRRSKFWRFRGYTWSPDRVAKSQRRGASSSNKGVASSWVRNSVTEMESRGMVGWSGTCGVIGGDWSEVVGRRTS